MQKDISIEQVNKTILPRPRDAHKGTFGRVLLVGGSPQFGGAIIMAAEACVNSGAGLTTVATNPLNLTALHTRIPEAMFINYQNTDQLLQQIKSASVIAIGPGLELNLEGYNLVRTVLSNVTKKQSLILDAGALAILVNNPELISQTKAKVVITPHQMEWQHLSGLKITDQESDKNLAALKKYGNQVTLVLKSAHTQVYDQSTIIWQNSLGNPGMATGGMGDTLTGIMAGIIAQFGFSTTTINTAVYLHSFTSDLLAQNNYIVLPTKLSALLPQVMNTFATKKLS